MHKQFIYWKRSLKPINNSTSTTSIQRNLPRGVALDETATKSWLTRQLSNTKGRNFDGTCEYQSKCGGPKRWLGSAWRSYTLGMVRMEGIQTHKKPIIRDWISLLTGSSLAAMTFNTIKKEKRKSQIVMKRIMAQMIHMPKFVSYPDVLPDPV